MRAYARICVCVCVCVCVRVCICICVHAFVLKLRQRDECGSVSTLCLFVLEFVYVRVCIGVHMFVHVRVYLCLTSSIEGSRKGIHTYVKGYDLAAVHV